jgi:tRNA pseudouridine38-40 synthase
VANLLTASAIPLRGFLRGLNALLPADIAVCSVQEAPLAFDARRHNHGKRYCYAIYNRRPPAPRLTRTSYHLHRPLDLQRMAAAARLLVGTHDFAAFRSASCDRETTVRTIYRCSVSDRGDGLVQLRVEGTAFLKHMVRIIAGTLIEVGKGQRPVESPAELLAGGQRAAAGFTAPAHGLCLERVYHYRPAP